jgi:prephenate dehydrogenase
MSEGATTTQTKKHQTVGVVGLGLIGGSVGLSLRDPSRELIGCDTSKEAQQVALNRFCVDRIAALDEVAQADVVFLAVPPGSVIDMAEAVLERKAVHTVVTDCASVKTEIARWAAERRAQDFVPGHPMAGHERTGAEFASAWLFRNARWILTPDRSTSKAAVMAVEKLVRSIGAFPIRLDPGTHDRHVAMLSHLPHALAAVLVLMGGEMEHIEIGAGSWRDVTRVGGVDPNLWAQILMGNRDELAKVLEEFEASLASIRGLLVEHDFAGLKQILEQARIAKAEQQAKLPEPEHSPIQRTRRRT